MRRLRMSHRSSCVLSLALLLVAGPALAQQSPAAGPRKIDRSEQDKALQTWSDESKRKAAQPVEMPVYELPKRETIPIVGAGRGAPKKAVRRVRKPKAAAPSVPGDV